MESKHFGHQHPLVLDDEQSNRSEVDHCSRCGEVVSGPCFSCAECVFYLHKACAEAPSQINHPFHPDHPLCLLSNLPAEYKGSFICNFCGETGKMFAYHCSCNIDLHIKCALFTLNIAENNFGDVEDIAIKDSSFPTQNSNKEVESSKCYWCWGPFSDSGYYSLDGGLNLHKKCVELSLEIDYPLDRNHLLTLQFSVEKSSCIVCTKTDGLGLRYCCSLCNIFIHVACLPVLPMEAGHKHQFTVFPRQMPFTCDACGVEGNSVPYLFLNCNLLVHKDCISLPPIIKFIWHEHPLFHSYYIRRDNSKLKNWDCVLCLDEVNTKYGSYYCSEYHFILHVNCATMRTFYYVVESIEMFNENQVLLEDSYIVIEKNEDEEATKIKHFCHEQNLMFSDKVLQDDEFCDGCTTLILDSFYHCLECNFFLHKKCAEFPKKKYIWLHYCKRPLILVTNKIFKCSFCGCICNGFVYECHEECGSQICLRCLIPLTLTCEGHEHPLSFLYSFEGLCSNCGNEIDGAYTCKICKFSLCFICVRQGGKVRNKCDEHPLALTYKDDNTCLESHFCDICEKDRNPSHWFYSCPVCDTSAHRPCVNGIGTYSYVKAGKIYNGGEHPHPLRFVKNVYYYPKCSHCDFPCIDLALECMEPGCGYVAHWDCICPSDLSEISTIVVD